MYEPLQKSTANAVHCCITEGTIDATEITTLKPPAVKVKTASTSTPAQGSTYLEEVAVTALTIQNGHRQQMMKQTAPSNPGKSTNLPGIRLILLAPVSGAWRRQCIQFQLK
jgi:hypothetical protein